MNAQAAAPNAVARLDATATAVSAGLLQAIEAYHPIGAAMDAVAHLDWRDPVAGAVTAAESAAHAAVMAAPCATRADVVTVVRFIRATTANFDEGDMLARLMAIAEMLLGEDARRPALAVA